MKVMTPEEARVAEMKMQVDGMVSKFQLCMAKFDDLLEKIPALNEKISLTENYLHLILSPEVVDLKSRYQSEVKKIADSVVSQGENVMGLFSSLQSVKATNQEDNHRIEGLMNNHNILQLMIRDIKESVKEIKVVKSEFDIFKNECLTCFQKVYTTQKDMVEINNALVEDVNLNRSQILDSKQELYSSQKSIQNLKSELSNFVSRNSDEFRLISAEMKSQEKSIREYIDQKFSEIRIPDVSGFLSLGKFKEVECILDRMGVDVKNSILKSTNNELMIGRHQKLIENIQLTQKNHELAR